jgi:hypothetical protein
VTALPITPERVLAAIDARDTVSQGVEAR